MSLSFEHMAAHLCVEKPDFVRPLLGCLSTTALAPAEFKMKFLILSYGDVYAFCHMLNF